MALELWTSPTPNGWKVNIMIEELIEAGIDVGPVEVRTIDLMKGEQFEDDFTERNPNQKIPTLRDGDRDVIESCAILQYLGEKHPSPLLPLDERKWDVLPWVYWQAANVGPVFGNKLSYTRYMDDVPDIKKEHPFERFNNEALRLVRVLDGKLGDNPWVCGDEFTIADISLHAYTHVADEGGFSLDDYPAINAWLERISHQRGYVSMAEAAMRLPGNVQ